MASTVAQRGPAHAERCEHSTDDPSWQGFRDPSATRSR
jgi:hypothetical protein